MDNLILYLNPFLIAFSLSVAILGLILILLGNFSLDNDEKRYNARHIHVKKVSRFGGLAIFGAFFITILLNEELIITKDIWGILLGGIVIFILGVWDDIRELDWRKQFFFQILAVALIFVFGAKINYLTNPWGDVIKLDSNFGFFLGTLIGLVWSLILINAMNWFDGIDGLSGGIYLIGLLTIFLLSLKPEVNQPPVGILSLALAGAVLGFLIFNFPPARIMAGSSGVFFAGFVMAGLSIFAGTKIATTMLVLFVPMIDFFWVIAMRIKKGKSIFSPDREHLHHKLLDIGWSQRQINILFYSITSLVMVVALSIKGYEKMFVIILLLIVMLSVYFFISNKAHHCKNRKS